MEPLDNKVWIRCLVPADQLELKDSNWSQIKHLPPIHVVGKISDSQLYEVTVCEFCVQWLRKHKFEFQLESERVFHYNVSVPSAGEVDVHGIRRATKKAQDRFIRDAVEGICSRHGRGLGQYYRQYTVDKHMLAVIEWAILIHDILVSFCGLMLRTDD